MRKAIIIALSAVLLAGIAVEAIGISGTWIITRGFYDAGINHVVYE